MKIYLVPQIPIHDHERIIYSFNGHKITAKINDIEETFDFEGVPDGKLYLHDENYNLKIKTQLEPFPILSVVKQKGILYVQLLNWIPTVAEAKDMSPSWISPSEYSVPVEAETEEGIFTFQRDFDTNSMEFIEKIQKERYKITNEHEELSKEPQ